MTPILSSKQKAINYYFRECNKLGIATDLWDYEAHLDSTLSYDELVNKMHDEYFDLAGNVLPQGKPSKQELTTILMPTLPLVAPNVTYSTLSKARSIYVFGGVRTGKTALVFGLCKELQDFKRVFWFKFPNRTLLASRGWERLDTLNQLSQLTNAVVVMEEYVLTMPHDKKNNDELQKILVLAGQNDLTIIIISQVSQVVNKRLESLIDCFICLDCDYQNLKNGSRLKNMIKEYSTFSPEHFSLPKGKFLYYSRLFPVFDKITTFPAPEGFTDDWSLAYKTTATQTTTTKPVAVIEW